MSLQSYSFGLLLSTLVFQGTHRRCFSLLLFFCRLSKQFESPQLCMFRAKSCRFILWKVYHRFNIGSSSCTATFNCTYDKQSYEDSQLTVSSFSTKLGFTIRFMVASVLKNFLDAPMMLPSSLSGNHLCLWSSCTRHTKALVSVRTRFILWKSWKFFYFSTDDQQTKWTVW